MNLGLKGKNVLVLASSDGIGKGIALEFAREGSNVMLFARREDKLKEVKKEIEDQNGGKAEYMVGDITNPQDIERVVDKILTEFGSIFVLINNTGGPPAGTFDKFDDDAWLQAFNLTLLSYIRSIRAVLPSMQKNKQGRIVNIASSSVKIILDNLILSNTFRMGIVGLSKTLASELGPYNIMVNVLGPGKILTDRVEHLDGIRAGRAGVSKVEYQKKVQDGIPLGRYGLPEEFAKMAVFLCSQANTYITGQTIMVDGGHIRAY